MMMSRSLIRNILKQNLITLCVALCSVQGVFAVAKISNANGNWNTAAIWTPAGVPAAADNVTITAGQTVTVVNAQSVRNLTVNGTLTWSTANILTIGGSINVNGVVAMNGGNITLTVPSSAFVLSAGSTFTWEPGTNTLAAAKLFTNGAENFSPTSTLIIKKWYDYTKALGSVVTGNFGNLILNSLNAGFVVEWNQNNQFQTHLVLGTLTIDQGWITLDKSGAISNTTLADVVLNNVNSYFYGHNGTHASSFTINIASVSNVGGRFYGLNDGNGNVTMNVSGNFTNWGDVKMINNSGVAGVCNGNATFNVGGIFSQSTGDTRIIYNVTTTNSGLFTSTINTLNLTGGIFMGQTACRTSGGTNTFNVTNNFTVNFASAASKFRGTSVSTMGASVNSVNLTMNIGGNLSVSGNAAAEFTSAASSGIESITIGGNVSVSGCAVNFNYGTASSSHMIITNITGNISVTGGTTFLSRNDGATIITIGGNLSVSAGTLNIKGGDGATDFTLTGNYNQSGGNFYLHNNGSAAATNVVTMNVSGDFTQTLGTFSFDSNPANGSSTHVLNILGSNYTVTGSGIITHAGAGVCTTFGQLNFTRSGNINFNHPGLTHLLQQVKQKIENGCTVTVMTGNFLVASHITPATDFLEVATGGRLEMMMSQISSNGVALNSGIQVDSAATIALKHQMGLYDGTMMACINANFGMDFYLDANSTVEYNGMMNQVVTGTGVGIATGTQHKYGRLKINFTGMPGMNFVAPNSSNVFIRRQFNLFAGEFNLNGNTVTVESGMPSAIIRTSGYIKSETPAVINPSVLVWKNMTGGMHVFPFGENGTTFLPVFFTPLTGMGGDVSISTTTSGQDNMPLPGSITGIITSMSQSVIDSMMAMSVTPTVPAVNMIDRWWNISATGFTANVTITYNSTENTLPGMMAQGTMSAVQWNGTGWNSQGIGTGVTAGTGTVTVNNVSTFSHWGIASNTTPLPILLSSFNAKLQGEIVYVSWTTATEINNDYFTVERSEDGQHFEPMSRVAGAGNSTSPLNYSSVDKTPLKGKSYYRLKQTDYDGKYTYSLTRSVTFNEFTNDDLTIEDFGPNPFETNFFVNYKVVTGGEVTILLSNAGGQTVFTKNEVAEEGTNRFEFNDEKNIPSGVYFLSIIYNDKKATQKLIKK